MTRHITLAILLAALALPSCGRREEIPPYETFLPPGADNAPEATMDFVPAGEIDAKAGLLRSKASAASGGFELGPRAKVRNFSSSPAATNRKPAVTALAANDESQQPPR